MWDFWASIFAGRLLNICFIIFESRKLVPRGLIKGATHFAAKQEIKVTRYFLSIRLFCPTIVLFFLWERCFIVFDCTTLKNNHTF